MKIVYLPEKYDFVVDMVQKKFHEVKDADLNSTQCIDGAGYEQGSLIYNRQLRAFIHPNVAKPSRAMESFK